MCKKIRNGNEYIGLEKQVFTFKPAHHSQFEHSLELAFDDEPENIIEEIRTMFKAMFEKINILQKQNHIQIGS